MAILTLSGIRLAFSGPPLLDGIDLQLETGDRLCLMGRNGSGKSTLMKIIGGELPPDGGEIARRQGLRAAGVSQGVSPDLTGTVFDLVAEGMGDTARLLAEYHHESHRLAASANAADLRRLETLQHRLEESGGWTMHQTVQRVLGRLSLDPEAQFDALSGGTRRRVLLARALVAAPDILLLDEPTNHLDIGAIVWLEEFLLRSARTVLFVTHDRAFARRVANRVAELDRGRLYTFNCGYDAFVDRREALLEAEITRQAAFEKKLAQEEAWLRQGVKARRTRDEGRVKALERLREEKRNRREQLGTVRMRMQEAERSGNLVAEAEEASFGYDQGRLVIRDLNTVIARGDRVGIIGPNGSGKTTLLRLLMGDLAPQLGRVVLGTRREVLYFDQMREQIDDLRTVWENVSEGSETLFINGNARHVIGYLRDFLFTPERANSPVSVLSGGERNRLMLARLFAKPANVLVMDEPTNDLDVETLDLLEELLADFSGTLLLVSHDREFLNRVVTSTLVLTGDGSVREYVGGYDDWLAQTAALNPPESPSPERPTPPRPRKAVEGPRRLTFREERELAGLPDRIAALEKEQADIQATMVDPQFYRTAGPEMARLGARLEAVERELETALERWVELEAVT